VRNIGRPGLALGAISAVDTALWDLKARLVGMPLAVLLGGAARPVAVYGSGGFTSYDRAETERQLRHWTDEQGIPRVKIKVGEAWGQREARDLARIRVARETVGDDVELYVDANGAYSPKQAVRVAAAFADHGVTWFEEPVSSDRPVLLARVRDAVAADVAAGEYGYDPHQFVQLAGAVDCVQADASRCGGVTGWMAAAAVVRAFGLDVSAHCVPAVHTHLAAAVPHCRHIEWFHDHLRIENLMFDGVPDPAGGTATPSADGEPGLGVRLVRERVEEYRVA
jgi:L-alanine-DL-glutamate epimerase-like enolase superfamily enzyme